MKDKLRKIVSNVFTYFVLGFVVIVSTLPIIWVMISSFKTNAQIMNDPFSLPTSLSFKAYMDVFEQYNLLQYSMNSLLIAVVSTTISLFIFSMGAYVIAKYDFWGKNFFFLLFTLTLIVPGHTKAQPIFSIISALDLYDTKAALMLVYISMGMALSVFILRSAFMSIPKDLNEAAEVDGMGFFRIFWSINLPLAKAGLSTAGILMFLNNWNEYFYAMLLTSSSENRTLPLALAFFNDAFSYDYTKMFAALTVAVIPGIIIYVVAQEQIQESFASSGVKG
jgi:raffinose/stachyose/melibiose transport system permease protein